MGNLKKILKNLHHFVSEFIDTVISLFLVLLYSKYCYSKIEKTDKNRCVILGNGPSLNNVLLNGELKYGYDYIAVNMFVQSNYFEILKPKYYFVADDGYFNPKTDRLKNLVQILFRGLNNVSWSMTLCVPCHKDVTSFVSKINNPNIRIQKLNTIQVSGFTKFRNYMFKHNWGMPKNQTVLIPAIFYAINKGYKELYIYGADHSWTKDLFVNDNNEVCYGDRHVYKTEITVVKKHNRHISSLLISFSNMFKSHELIASYANCLGCKVYNSTEGSFIDAYERKVLKLNN